MLASFRLNYLNEVKLLYHRVTSKIHMHAVLFVQDWVCALVDMFRTPLSVPLFILSYSRETYNALTNWLTDARTLASPNIVIILCGNKKDLDADREVTFLEASRFAQENGN